MAVKVAEGLRTYSGLERVQSIVEEDRGPQRGYRALEGDGWLRRRQRAVERTEGRRGDRGP
jgi:hypothetical protein